MPLRRFRRHMLIACLVALAPTYAVAQAAPAVDPAPADASIDARIRQQMAEGGIVGMAAAIILVHNHPSGDPTPSAEDVAITRRLRDVGELMGVRVLAHVIIGHGRYVSFSDEGL